MTDQDVAHTDPIFDYRELDAETDMFVRERVEKIRGLGNRASRCIVDIGRHLTEIKERLPHGRWVPWLQKEFTSWSERSALRFMQAHEVFGENGNLSNLAAFLDPSSVYRLAAPSTPEPARQEVLAKVAAGETVRHKDVKEIVEKHKPTPPIIERVTEHHVVAVGYEMAAERSDERDPATERDAYRRSRAEAIDRVVTRMRELRQKFGPNAVTAAIQAYGAETEGPIIDAMDRIVGRLRDGIDSSKRSGGGLRVVAETPEPAPEAEPVQPKTLGEVFRELGVPELPVEGQLSMLKKAEELGIIEPVPNGADPSIPDSDALLNEFVAFQKRTDITSATFAAEAGMSPATISNWRNGNRDLARPATRQRVAETMTRLEAALAQETAP